MEIKGNFDIYSLPHLLTTKPWLHSSGPIRVPCVFKFPLLPLRSSHSIQFISTRFLSFPFFSHSFPNVILLQWRLAWVSHFCDIDCFFIFLRDFESKDFDLKLHRFEGPETKKKGARGGVGPPFVWSWSLSGGIATRFVWIYEHEILGLDTCCPCFFLCVCMLVFFGI